MSGQEYILCLLHPQSNKYNLCLDYGPPDITSPAPTWIMCLHSKQSWAKQNPERVKFDSWYNPPSTIRQISIHNSVFSASDFRSFLTNSEDLRKSTDLLPNSIDFKQIHRLLGINYSAKSDYLNVS